MCSCVGNLFLRFAASQIIYSPLLRRLRVILYILLVCDSFERDSVYLCGQLLTTTNMSDAFSSHSTDPINRTIDLAPAATPEDLDTSLEEVYEVLETVAELNKHDFRRVSRIVPA